MKKKEPALRIGQAAAQLGASPHHLRQLCKCGMIEAEQSAGGQWRIPLAEIERLEMEGVPPAPVFTEEPEPGAPPPASRSNRLAPPSDAVIEAEEAAEIEAAELRRKESRVHKLRLTVEEQQAQDELDAHDRRQAELAAAERRKAEAAEAQRKRRKWEDDWRRHALNLVPHGARREVELEVHQAAEAVLAGLQPSHDYWTVKRLVDAAAEKAIRPWRRKQDINRAIKAAMNSLPVDVQYGSDFCALKQRASETVSAAVGRCRAEATYRELEASAIRVLQPMIQEYEHLMACRRALSSIYLSGADSEERERATDAAQKALSALPVGAGERQIREAQATALAPFQAAIAEREKAKNVEEERQRRRRDADWTIRLELNHIEKYLNEAFEFPGGHYEMARERDRLRPLVQEALVKEYAQHPNMKSEYIRHRIEKLVDKLIS